MASHDSSRGIPLGFGGLSASPGDHIVHFYQSPDERLAVQVPFIAAGLQANDKCMVLRPPEDDERLRAALQERGVEVNVALERGQLEVVDGLGTVTELRALLAAAVQSIPESFDFLRWCGDMTWTFGKVATTKVLMEWECACNVVRQDPVAFMCHYDLNLFSGALVIDALRTHPLSVVGQAVHQNPYYQTPEEFLAKLPEQPDTELVATG